MKTVGTKSRLVRRLLGVGVGVALGCIAGLAAIELRSQGFWQPGPLVDSEIFVDYEVRVYCRHDENLLEKVCDKLPYPLSGLQNRIPGVREWNGVEVLKRGRRVYSQYGNWTPSGLHIAEFGTNRIAGLDITGDGVPKLALTDEIGRQGGGSLLVFACGEEFKKIADIESWGKYPEFKDLDGDGIPELIVSDNAFYHWPVLMDGEPMPEVILRWRNGGYVPAGDLMVKPALSQAEVDALAAEIQGSSDWDSDSCSVPEALWTNAVALLYSGHEDLGWKFVDLAWKPGFPGKGASKDYLIDNGLRARLDDSVYWPELHRQMSSLEGSMKRGER